ncbi:MazG nucleotide pyrophosphohydrolase domain-containing protein [Arthrobacter sp. Marseille-P9274]|uniref:MazG nucleotide pyrophosphohydrolase domain-containing protein n=1 Tax=Arthrobacter sp. Marseille-P9274 TaxID=2866572 RepID=UPI0027B99C4A|nr:MazG nucleotide pyrophosphohydrolase domain-containing protein [Arthrobacter sp. Marseille-P9274]
MARLVEVVAQLREHCLWTAALTHESLVEYLVEESYELAEAIETGHTRAEDAEELKGELADVLFQVLLHARIQEERGTFDFDEVARFLTGKLVRRNRHVFRPDGTLQDSFPATVEEIVAGYDAAKAAEKPGRSTPFDGIPRSLPALTLAAKSLDRAARARIAGAEGTDSPATTPPAEAAAPVTEDDIGNLLFDVVRHAVTNGVDAEQALRAAVRRFQRDVTGP